MKVGRWVLDRLLGSGGMGSVHAAHREDDPAVRVAIKILARVDERSLARFRREAELLPRVNHTGIVRVQEVGTERGTPFIVMDLVEGRSLRALVQESRGPWPLARALALVRAIADAVGAAHGAGVCHRDLKPENILVDAEDAPRIVDFGLSLAEDSPRLTTTGVFLGTPGYMPPEQIRGEKHRQGPPSDVYALGAILYELATGERPFPGEPFESLAAAEAGDLVPATSANPALPRELDVLLARALAPEPGDRWPDGRALAAAIRELQDGRAVAPPGSRRTGAIAGVVLGVAVLGAAGLVGGAKLLGRRADSPRGGTTPGAATPVAGSLAPVDPVLARVEAALREKDPRARLAALEPIARANERRYGAAVVAQAEASARGDGLDGAIDLLVLASRPLRDHEARAPLATARARLLLERAGRLRAKEGAAAVEARLAAFEADPLVPSPPWYPGLVLRLLEEQVGQGLDARNEALARTLVTEVVAEGATVGLTNDARRAVQFTFVLGGDGSRAWEKIVNARVADLRYGFDAWEVPRSGAPPVDLSGAPPRLAAIARVVARAGPLPPPDERDPRDLVGFAIAADVPEAERSRAFEKALALARERVREVDQACGAAPEDGDLALSRKIARAYVAEVLGTWAASLRRPSATPDAEAPRNARRVEKLRAALEACPTDLAFRSLWLRVALATALRDSKDSAGALAVATELDADPGIQNLVAHRPGPEWVDVSLALDVFTIRGTADTAVEPPRLEDARAMLARLADLRNLVDPSQTESRVQQYRFIELRIAEVEARTGAK